MNEPIPSMVFQNFFSAGGLGMYPVSICGFLLVASAVLLALRPERRFLWLVISTGLMTLGSGVLSSLTGLANLLHYLATIPSERRGDVSILGLADNLHCLMFTMIFIQSAFWLVAVAALRGCRKQSVVAGASSEDITTASAA